MAFTDDELVTVRSWVPWDPPTDAQLDAAHDRLGRSMWRVIEEQLRTRLSTLVGSPATFAVAGEYSQSTGENIRQLREDLATVRQYIVAEEAGEENPTSIAGAQLIRPDRRRGSTSWPF